MFPSNLLKMYLMFLGVMMGIIGAANAVENTTRRRPVHPHATGKVAGGDLARGRRPGSTVGAAAVLVLAVAVVVVVVLLLVVRAVLRRTSDVVVQCMANMKATRFAVVAMVSAIVVGGDVAAPSGAGGARPPAVAGIAAEPLPADSQTQTQTGKGAKAWIVALLQYYQESRNLWSLTRASDRAVSKVNPKQYIGPLCDTIANSNK